jgi:FKBP-type peptidyl-prolyl cis-trans isomerase (trigger factor)
MAEKITAAVAKQADGTVQITFSLPWNLVEKAKSQVVADLAKDIEVPGFRKGNAPVAKAEEKIPLETIIQKVVGSLLPAALADAINDNKLKLALYPHVHVLKADNGEAWQVQAETCELPEVALGNYKETVKGALKASQIWTPDKGKDEKAKEPSNEEKQQEVIKVLLSSIKINIPKILVDEEVDARLSSLLSRIEKLGLTLEGYLGSLGKTGESLRDEYRKQAEDTLALDLILDKIALEEKVQVSETQIDEVIKASAADKSLQEKLNTPEQRRMIMGILRRRASLDSLISLL